MKMGVNECNYKQASFFIPNLLMGQVIVIYGLKTKINQRKYRKLRLVNAR
jgi:hypothetical protein